MAHDDDVLDIIDDHDEPAAAPLHAPWVIAIIDDDPAVHQGTRFALADYVLHDQGLEILSAYSAEEGRRLLKSRRDIAVILLDVVMESDSAGLDFVDYVRRELRDETVRIILRTGQPGQAPERRVIVGYDINDYKAKTELTADKLFTSLTAALRSYQQLKRLEETRRGLEIIIDAAPRLFDFRSMQRLAEGVLTQMASLLDVECAGILLLRDGARSGGSFAVLAGSGCYSPLVGCDPISAFEADLHNLVHGAFERRCNEFLDRRSLLYIETGSGREVVVLLDADKRLSETDRALVELLSSRLSVAFDNVILYDQLQEANARLEERVRERTAELTRINHRLAAQSGELHRANRLKSEILGTVAHDLKNPLGVILGRTEILNELVARTPPEVAPMRAQIGHIRDSATRLTDMVNSLIKDAMNDALDITIRGDAFDLAALVREVAAGNEALAARKGQTLACEAPDHLIITGDPDRLREAVDNLVSNAIKYSPAGSPVVVAVRPRENEVEVSVRDRGPGLSPEDMDRLFGRFQRLSAKPTGGESSTGLGLFIVKRIVELHGGRVAAHSDGIGQGATFALVLPWEPDGRTA
jgi:signal transduction histidine kinase/CheY-like chemotaxis protein